MGKPLNLRSSEIVFSDAETSRETGALVQKGLLRRLARGILTSNLLDKEEAIVRRNIWEITSHLFPDALISDRTALENSPSSDGSVFIISKRVRDFELPGHTIKPRDGHPPLSDDLPFYNIHLSSQARALLENMRPSRSRDGNITRTLSKYETEAWMLDIIQKSGESTINRLRDQARTIAESLGQSAEFKQLDDIIGSVFGTHKSRAVSQRGILFSQNRGFDTARVDLFENLRVDLSKSHLDGLPHRDAESERLLPFFEAYFSNYIEGTQFPVDVARGIVFDGNIPTSKPNDAHDITGTFRLLSARKYGEPQYSDFTSFVSYLQNSHRAIAQHRPDIRPGNFKLVPNEAGSTVFVQPSLTLGTLEKGFEMLKSLPKGLPRGIFASFLVSEVHPFDDGNGRVARAVLNQELADQKLSPIIIPTVYRTEYIQSLKALSADSKSTPFLRVLDFASRYTHSVDFSSYDKTKGILEKTNAFVEPEYAVDRGIRLNMPEPVEQGLSGPSTHSQPSRPHSVPSIEL